MFTPEKQNTVCAFFISVSETCTKWTTFILSPFFLLSLYQPLCTVSLQIPQVLTSPGSRDRMRRKLKNRRRPPTAQYPSTWMSNQVNMCSRPCLQSSPCRLKWRLKKSWQMHRWEGLQWTKVVSVHDFTLMLPLPTNMRYISIKVSPWPRMSIEIRIVVTVSL